MIYKITTKSEIEALKGHLPVNVISEAEHVADILDEYYNSQGMGKYTSNIGATTK